MIVGGYTLHLYCDVPGCNYNSKDTGKYTPDEFTGESGGGCRKAARKAGWRLCDGDATCPDCNKKG